MTENKNRAGAQLHAYVDGELDAAARAEVASWLAESPDDAARVGAYRSQIAALHREFDGVLLEPMPAHLSEILSVPSPSYRLTDRSWFRAAAAIALFAAGVGGGWLARDAVPSSGGSATALVTQAVGAHAVYVSEVRHPVEVGVDQEAHLVGWLSKRLGHKVRPPDMSAAGFKLIGGRLLPDAGQAAAQFMYEDDGGRRVTLYVRAAAGDNTAFKFATDNGISAFYWIDGPLAYAITGTTSREKLLRLARIAYEAL